MLNNNHVLAKPKRPDQYMPSLTIDMLQNLGQLSRQPVYKQAQNTINSMRQTLQKPWMSRVGLKQC